MALLLTSTLGCAAPRAAPAKRAVRCAAAAPGKFLFQNGAQALPPCGLALGLGGGAACVWRAARRRRRLWAAGRVRRFAERPTAAIAFLTSRRGARALTPLTLHARREHGRRHHLFRRHRRRQAAQGARGGGEEGVGSSGSLGRPRRRAGRQRRPRRLAGQVGGGGGAGGQALSGPAGRGARRWKTARGVGREAGARAACVGGRQRACCSARVGGSAAARGQGGRGRNGRRSWWALRVAR